MTVLVYRGWASFLSLLCRCRWLVIATLRHTAKAHRKKWQMLV